MEQNTSLLFASFVTLADVAKGGDEGSLFCVADFFPGTD
jgi:hypothetical protein